MFWAYARLDRDPIDDNIPFSLSGSITQKTHVANTSDSTSTTSSTEISVDLAPHLLFPTS